MIFNTQLETPRLLLRGFNQESYHNLFAQYTQPQIMEILGVSTQEEYDLEQSRYQGGYSTYNLTIQFFQLVDKESQRVLGWCGYHSWAKQHKRAEVFYSLKNETDKRKGIMSEALNEVLKYGKTEMKLARVS